MFAEDSALAQCILCSLMKLALVSCFQEAETRKGLNVSRKEENPMLGDVVEVTASPTSNCKTWGGV
jgi:hypothetical protein